MRTMSDNGGLLIKGYSEDEMDKRSLKIFQRFACVTIKIHWCYMFQVGCFFPFDVFVLVVLLFTLVGSVLFQLVPFLAPVAQLYRLSLFFVPLLGSHNNLKNKKVVFNTLPHARQVNKK